MTTPTRSVANPRRTRLIDLPQVPAEVELEESHDELAEHAEGELSEHVAA